MTEPTTPSSLPERLWQWAAEQRRRYALVQGEATMETLRRFRIFAAVTLLVDLVYINEFWFKAKPAAAFLQQDYVELIGWAHCVMGATMLVLGSLAHALVRGQARATPAAVALQLSICAAYLVFGIAVSVIDQMVSTSITSFVLVCVLVGVVSLMRPRMTLPLLLIAYALLYYAVAMVQKDPAALDRIRGDGRLVVLMSLIVSAVVWVQYVASVLLRRDLVQANQALAGKQAELLFTSTHDELTGLINRREFVRLALVELARTARVPGPISLVMVDVDFFKKINDRYGHPAGDEVLQQMAQKLSAGVRTVDIVARMGGEEFVILLPNTSREGALAVAEKIRASLAEAPFQLRNASLRVTASFGVSELPARQSGTLEDLYAAADQALYAAKNGGRNRVEFEAAQSLAFPSNFVSLRAE